MWNPGYIFGLLGRQSMYRDFAELACTTMYRPLNGEYVRARVPRLGVEAICSMNWGSWTREGTDKGGIN